MREEVLADHPEAKDDCIPPLITPDGAVVTHSRDKAMMLASFFSNKMTVPDPERPPHIMPNFTDATLDIVTITTEEVGRQLVQVDPTKAPGSDNVSSHLLKHCAAQLAMPFTTIFQCCLY